MNTPSNPTGRDGTQTPAYPAPVQGRAGPPLTWGQRVRVTAKIGLMASIALLLTLVALCAALWLWAGSSHSLATTLQLAQHFLPAGQSLVTKDVRGALRTGGTVGQLRWQQGALSVEAHQVQVSWALRHLLDGELRISQLQLAHLRIEDQRPKTAPQPPSDLRLPLKVDATFALGTLEWAGSTPVRLTQLSGRYSFDRWSHAVYGLKTQLSSANYTLNGSVQAQAPMALALTVNGSVNTQWPAAHQAVQVQARAQVKGELAGREAVLALTAQLTPTLAGSTAMQAQVSAHVQPWQAQPVRDAQAQWQALDLSVLWPQAPQTQLSGHAAVTPDPPSNSPPSSPSWHAQVQASNAQSGPWNQHRLPLSQLDAQVTFAQGQWQINALKARGAGGQLAVQGQFSAVQHWAGTLNVQGIRLDALDTRWPATPLKAQLKLQQNTDQIAADGQLQTQDAQVQGQINYRPSTQAAQGQLALTVPGARASIKGELAPTQGGGDLSAKVQNAAHLTRWLQAWPGMARLLGPTELDGQAELNGHWQGGWQGPLPALQLQAQLRAPQLTLRRAAPAADRTWHLSNTQADLTGTLAALSLRLKAQLDTGTQHLALQAQATGGQTSPGHWQTTVSQAQLSAQDSQKSGPWTLKTQSPVQLQLNTSGPSTQVAVSAASAQLTGPSPGTARLTWAPAHWQHTQWRTEGQLQNLPLNWLTLLSPASAEALAVQGNLLLRGQWKASGGDALHLSASLERSSGDLQLRTEDAKSGALQAGVRDARLSVSVDADALASQFTWDSERAGQVQAQFNTRLRLHDQAWQWPADAPLSGSLNAQLPPVGAWSLLAPPGWRLHGTLDAKATLSGTRSEPQWHGQLGAQDLAVRSVVDGIDFSQGRLRASLDGQRLTIDDFTLQGAGGRASGGLLRLKGHVQWLPGAPAAPTLAARFRMTLDASAQALRVSARADRRLAVSGQLHAQLADARLRVTGALTADQALFILPEDTAPQLGSDVRLRAPASTASPSPALRPPAKPAPSTGLRITPQINITLDLGPDFAVRGHGLSTRLAGQLTLRNGAQNTTTPSLTGDLHTVLGTFKAYGQQLDLEEGLLRFTGPLNNPALNILAIRPNLSQRVGVQISGTALSPVVRLYAEPELAEAEKLAWLLLGRSSAKGGAESALVQQAALALLGGKGQSGSGGLAGALGLDELSVRGTSSSEGGTGAALTLGKRLSRDLYVAYEHSLAGTLGTFYIFYDLSRRFTLRAQTGEQSAVDLIFTLRYDTLSLNRPVQ